MALAGRAHVVLARQAQLHRSPRLPGEHGGNAGDDGRLALLAAERAAHAPNLDRDGVKRQAEKVRDAVLDFGRMLGRAPHVHVAAFAGGGERDLPFEIEVVLPAAAQFAGQAMRRACECRLDLAAHHELRRRNVVFASHRLFDREHRRKRLVIDHHQLGRRPRLIEGRRGDRGDRLSLVFDDARRQCRLVAADRRDAERAMSFWPGISAAVMAATTPGASSAAERSMRRMRACACGLSTNAASSVPGTVGTSSR